MKSHRYEFNSRQIAQALLPALVPVLLFALFMHGGAAVGRLPSPRPTLDADQTIVVHQAETTVRTNNAEIIFLGDSSCLMDVDTPQLTALLNHETLNLGTLSFLDLRAFGRMAQQYLRHNLNRLRAVVVMLNPAALRRTSPQEYHVRLLESFYARQDLCPSSQPTDLLYCGLGLEMFRGRLVSRLLPSALAGDYGRYYGFSHDLDRYMTSHKGCMIDPGAKPFEGNRQFLLAGQQQAASASFRAAIPRDITLIVGLTPVPAGFAPSDYPQTHQELLKQWSQWMQADITLSGLPGTLPDKNFARVTHLNAAGRIHFTRLLAAELRALNLFQPKGSVDE